MCDEEWEQIAPTSLQVYPSMDMNTTIEVIPTSPKVKDHDCIIKLPYTTPNQSLILPIHQVREITNQLFSSSLYQLSLLQFESDIHMAIRKENRIPSSDISQWVRIIIPSLPTETSMKWIEMIFKRIKAIYQVTNILEMPYIVISIIPFLSGTYEEKITSTIKIIQDFYNVNEMKLNKMKDTKDTTVERYGCSILRDAFLSLLLTLSAIFSTDNATEEQLVSSGRILASSIDQMIARLFTFYGLAKDDFISMSAILSWISTSSQSISWIRMIDPTNWPTEKHMQFPASSASSILSSRSVPGALQPASSNDVISDQEYKENIQNEASTDNNSPAQLYFQFSNANGGFLVVEENQAMQLYDLLEATAFTKLHPQTLYDTFVQHTIDGMLEDKSYTAAVEELLSLTTGIRSSSFRDDELQSQLLQIYHCFAPLKGTEVDAFEIAAGFSIFTWGSKSDKLAAAFHYFDVDSKGYLNNQQMWRFLRSVLMTLFYLSPPNKEVIEEYSSLGEFIDTGESDTLQKLQEGIREVQSQNMNFENVDSDGEIYAFEDFGIWYNAGGYKSMSWLELLDLRKWAFVSPDFVIENLDTEPIDPSRTGYNLGGKVNVDVDDTVPFSSTSTGQPPSLNIYDDIDSNKAFRKWPASSAINSLFSSQASQIPLSMELENGYRTLNASPITPIELKNEVVLDFDLSVNSLNEYTNGNSIPSLQLTNGDLVRFAELQRVMNFQEISLNRLYEAFEPVLNSATNNFMEERSFIDCVKRLQTSGRHLEPTPENQRAYDMLARLFLSFNRHGTGKIDTIEFITAFTLFFAGSKSDKLAFAFSLFDANSDSCLSRREMWKFFRSFLTILLALGNGAEISAEGIANAADNASIEITDKIFRDCWNDRHNEEYERDNFRQSTDDQTVYSEDEASNQSTANIATSLSDQMANENKSDSYSSATLGTGNSADLIVVSFEAFAQWYSNHGYSIVAWIELLDVTKWPKVQRSVAHTIRKYVNHQMDVWAARASSTKSVPLNSSKNNVVSSIGNRRLERLRTAESFSSSSSSISSLIPSYTSKHDISAVAIQFPMAYDNLVLSIRLKDVTIVYTVAERLTFRKMGCDEIVHLLQLQQPGRFLTKQQFISIIRGVVPASELAVSEQEFLSFHILRLFSLFQVENTEHSTAEKLHLIAGLSIFSGTSKSAKLSVLFRIFDENESGYISRRHVFELMKSILLVLFAYSNVSTSTGSEANSSSIHSAADRSAGVLISKLFGDVELECPDSISLPEFANWYAAGGFKSCPWLELLDLSKWPANEAFEASKKLMTTSHHVWVDAFDIMDEGKVVHFTEKDIETYLYVLKSTKLYELDLHRLYEAVLENTTLIEGNELILTRSQFYNCIRKLVPANNMSEDTQKKSSKLLTRLFNVYDLHAAGHVNALELACGMSLLGKGTKSQKLAMAFTFLTNVQHGRNSLHSSLSYAMLFLYLRSFLLAFMGISEDTYSHGLEKMYTEANAFIHDAMNDLLKEIGNTANPEISFDVFGEWYNRGGFQLISWLELLDVSKWMPQNQPADLKERNGVENRKKVAPMHNFRQSDIVSTQYLQKFETDAVKSAQDACDTFDPQGLTDGEMFESPTMVFAVAPEAAELQFFNDDIRRLQTFLSQSKLHRVSPWAFSSALQKWVQSSSQHKNNHSLRSNSTKAGQTINLEVMISELQSMYNICSSHDEKESSNTIASNSSNVSSAPNAISLLRAVLQPFVIEDEQHDGQGKSSIENTGKDDEYESENRQVEIVNFDMAVCGLLLLCEGSILEKLKCGAQLLRYDMEPHEILTDVNTFKKCLQCFLMAFYGMSSSLSRTVVIYSAGLGAEDVLEGFNSSLLASSTDNAVAPSISPTSSTISIDSPPRQQTKNSEHDQTKDQSSGSTNNSQDISLKKFNDWFCEIGFHSHPWLELVELKHWPAAINVCGESTSTLNDNSKQ